jgi:DNA topoisomerase-1
MGDLIVLESPNKVSDVEKYAKKFGLDAKVVATCGHVLDLPDMAKGVAVDIDRFEPTSLAPRDSSAAQRAEKLKAAIAKAERVIVATDPDREGEAIAAQVWRWIPKGRGLRARFEEITAAGVAAGLSNMEATLDEKAVDASMTRRLVDRLAGWHATDLVFKKLPQRKGMSAGRLQSAALRLVVERFREFQAFRPETTFGVRLQLRTSGGVTFTARLQAENGSAIFSTRSAAEAIGVPKTVRVVSLTVEDRSERPRPPFEATSWLQVAQKVLGLSVKEATAATQELFEKGCTTYPRTDSVRASDESIAWARQQLERRFGPSFVPATPWEHRDGGSSQGAHEAIRPTLGEDALELKARTGGKWGSAYALIENRFLASQAAARCVQRTKAIFKSDDHHYLALGDVELFAGWRAVLGTDAKEEETGAPKKRTQQEAPDQVQAGLPRLKEGEILEVVGFEVVANTTKPKPLFSQAALVAELKRRGIGRPSTYHSVVPLLTGRGWVQERSLADERKSTVGKRLPVLVPTEMGSELCDFLARSLPGLVNYEFTAHLEDELDQVAKGGRTRIDVGHQWWKLFATELALAQKLEPKPLERPDLGSCPRCSGEGRTGRLRLIKGKSRDGKAFAFAGCDSDTKEAKVCGFTAPVDSKGEVLQGLVCPVCGDLMRPVHRRDGGHSYVCRKDGWFLANRDWKLAKSPVCPTCTQPMTHRERSEARGTFFWACFGDRAFADSDVFGAIGPVRVTHPSANKGGARG